MVRRGFQEPDTYDDDDDNRGPGGRAGDNEEDREHDEDDLADYAPDEDDLADYEAQEAGRAPLDYAADVTVRLSELRALAEWVCDRKHRRRLAALVVDGADVVLWHEGRTTPHAERAAAQVDPDGVLTAELPTATRLGIVADLDAVPRGWQDPHGETVTMTCPGCRRDYTAAPSGGTVAQMLYLGLLDVVELNRLPAAVRDHLQPQRVAPRRGSALCFVAHRVTH